MTRTLPAKVSDERGFLRSAPVRGAGNLNLRDPGEKGGERDDHPPTQLSRHIFGDAIATFVGANARPWGEVKPVTTGVTTPVFKSTKPITPATFSAV
jgi:hypothetical protein